MVGLDSQILLHPQTWVASGHVDSFTDPMVEDLVNHKRYRADSLLEDFFAKNPDEQQGIVIADLSTQELDALLEKFQIQSPDNNPLSKTQDFNILFETAIGAVNDKKTKFICVGKLLKVFSLILNKF